MSTIDLRPRVPPGSPTPACHPGADVLTATGVEKSFPRAIWPRRRKQSVLRGADLTLHPTHDLACSPEQGADGNSP